MLEEKWEEVSVIFRSVLTIMGEAADEKLAAFFIVASTAATFLLFLGVVLGWYEKTVGSVYRFRQGRFWLAALLVTALNGVSLWYLVFNGSENWAKQAANKAATNITKTRYNYDFTRQNLRNFFSADISEQKSTCAYKAAANFAEESFRIEWKAEVCRLNRDLCGKEPEKSVEAFRKIFNPHGYLLMDYFAIMNHSQSVYIAGGVRISPTLKHFTEKFGLPYPGQDKSPKPVNLEESWQRYQSLLMRCDELQLPASLDLNQPVLNENLAYCYGNC